MTPNTSKRGNSVIVAKTLITEDGERHTQTLLGPGVLAPPSPTKRASCKAPRTYDGEAPSDAEYFTELWQGLTRNLKDTRELQTLEGFDRVVNRLHSNLQPLFGTPIDRVEDLVKTMMSFR